MAELKAEIQEQIDSRSQLHLYDTLAVAYRYEGDRPIGLVVMHFPLASDAQTDLEPRHKMAEEGISSSAKVPYRESIFTLDTAAVEGNNLVLRLRPFDDQSMRLFQMLIRRDMLFAACP